MQTQTCRVRETVIMSKSDRHVAVLIGLKRMNAFAGRLASAGFRFPTHFPACG
jgi:hypothetical protein